MSESRTALILVGGAGTRLRPVVADRPKALAEVGGHPFLERLLAQLSQANLNIHRVVLCTGYMGDRVQKALGERYGQLELIYSHESSPLGTAGAIRNALPLIPSWPVLVLNGDSFCDLDLAAYSAHHQAKNASASIALTRVNKPERYGQVEINDSDEIVRFSEKGQGDGSGWVNAGIYLLTCPVVESIATGRAVSIEYDIFPAWIGRRLYGYRGGQHFIDIGTPASYAQANRFFEEL